MPFQRFSRRLLLPLATIAVAITVLAAFPNSKQTSRVYPSQNNNRKQSAEMVIPIVDYDDGAADNKLAASAESKSLELRKLRNGRYDNRVWVQKDEQRSQILSTNHWWLGLSALPVAQSDAIVLGEIVESQAYLSKDKSGVYSEFDIRINEVLKAPKTISLFTGDIIIGERAGGAVRFPSGRITQYFFLGQGFPRAGRLYLLFLKMNEYGQDFHILTGYQLRRRKVQALDQTDIFAQYEGRDQNSFFNDLREAIAQAEKDSPTKGGEIK